MQELESEKSEFEEARKVTVSLSDRVLRLGEIEKELASKRIEVVNLRLAIQNKVMLEEMVHNLETKLNAIKDREKEIPVLKVMHNFSSLIEFEMQTPNQTNYFILRRK